MTSTDTTQHDEAGHQQAVRSFRVARGAILLGAFLSFLFSVTLWFTGSREEGLFVGLWVPSILSLGSLVLPPSEQ